MSRKSQNTNPEKEIVGSEEEKLLGITIDNNLKMNKHMKKYVNKLVIN